MIDLPIEFIDFIKIQNSIDYDYNKCEIGKNKII
jgi:hypothetical protein